jgi:hypothetical protein
MSRNLPDVKAQDPEGCIHTIVIHALLRLPINPRIPLSFVRRPERSHMTPGSARDIFSPAIPIDWTNLALEQRSHMAGLSINFHPKEAYIATDNDTINQIRGIDVN